MSAYMKIPYAAPRYGPPEVRAVVDVLENPDQIASGPKVRAFERKIAALFGHAHGVMVNSGSSANLLALASLELPKGAKVVTPACTFATTVAPIVQLGLEPVFVDVEADTYMPTVRALYEAALCQQADAILLPLLLGNGAPRRIYYSSVPLIVDSCDTLGCEVPWADAVTTSFYASHVITAAGGGGMVCFQDADHADRARLRAHWGRASTLMDTDDVAERYAGGEYDRKFLFTEMGYNLQPLELQAAFGLKQLTRLGGFLSQRRENFTHLQDGLAPHEDVLVLPRALPGANWLAFPLTVREDAPFTRYALARHLEAHGIQTRPIMAGNILRQPGFQNLGTGEFPVSDSIMDGGLLVGLHQGLGDSEIGFMLDVLRGFLT